LRAVWAVWQYGCFCHDRDAVTHCALACALAVVCDRGGHMDVASISHRLQGHAQDNGSQGRTAEAGRPTRHTMGDVARDTKPYHAL
jgi:hypothetical protein